MHTKFTLCAAIVGVLFIGAGGSPIRAQVGYQSVEAASDGSASIPVSIWYPTATAGSEKPLGLFKQTVAPDAPNKGRALHLIVISHGNGGAKDGHYDTALALAKAGFVVAALEHTGDNYRDQSRATDVANRPRELHRLINYVVSEWAGHAALDPSAVGAFGFSSGGLTVLAAAGGEPYLSLVASHCAAHPRFYDCTLVAAHGARTQARKSLSMTAGYAPWWSRRPRLGSRSRAACLQ